MRQGAKQPETSVTKDERTSTAQQRATDGDREATARCRHASSPQTVVLVTHVALERQEICWKTSKPQAEHHNPKTAKGRRTLMSRVVQENTSSAHIPARFGAASRCRTLLMAVCHRTMLAQINEIHGMAVKFASGNELCFFRCGTVKVRGTRYPTGITPGSCLTHAVVVWLFAWGDVWRGRWCRAAHDHGRVPEEGL